MSKLNQNRISFYPTLLNSVFFLCFIMLACSTEAPKAVVPETAKDNLSIVQEPKNSAEAEQKPVVEKTAAQKEKPLKYSTPPISEKKEILKTEKNQSISEKPSMHILKIDSNNVEKSENAVILDYGRWNETLQKYVSAMGRVNYRGLKSDQTEFDAFLKLLSENPPKEDWKRTEKLAYWINTYNAFTIKLILDNYPLKKITDLDGGKTWDVKRIEISGKKYSLNQIENDIIRPKFKDARIHFAVNCGAIGCPPLLNQAFLPETLDDQLGSRTRAFIRNEKFNQISAEKAGLSKIFDWYGTDFGDVKTYLNKYLKVKINESVTIGFNEYDWNLNE